MVANAFGQPERCRDLSTGTAALLGTAILFALPGRSAPLRALPVRLLGALKDLWSFLRTRNGALIAVLCVTPFGAGTESSLIGAIAREWAVSPDQLALFGTLGAAINMAGAVFGGWLSTRIGPWNAYLLLGWTMIVVMVGFAFSPRAAAYFMAVELFYRALATASYATLLAIVMKAIGKGAASTKAAGMWSLTNLAFAYPTLIEGSVHDRAGTLPMLLTDVSLAVIGFGVLMLAIRVLRPGIHTLAETVDG